MKINLSTPPASVLSTLAEETPKARKAYAASFGGPKAYDMWQNKQLDQIPRAKQNYIGKTFFWTSPAGNKWCVFEFCEYNYLYPHTCNYAFCYFETAQYGGLFFPCDTRNPITGEESKSAILYEPHFFERCHERNIYTWKGIDTLVDFISKNRNTPLYGTDPDSNRIDLRFDKCIGRGFIDKELGVKFIRIKTVLSDEQLSTRQRKDTALGRRWGDAIKKYSEAEEEHAYYKQISKALEARDCGTLDQLVDEMQRDFARYTGLTQEQVNLVVTLVAGIKMCIFDLFPSVVQKYILQTNHSELLNSVIDLVIKFGEDNDNDEFDRTFMDITIKEAKRLGRTLTKQNLIQYRYRKLMQHNTLNNL